jgi:hypothetical protein
VEGGWTTTFFGLSTMEPPAGRKLVVLLPNADLRNGTFSTRVLKNKRVRYSPPVQGWPGGSGKIEWVIGHQDSEAYATTKTLLPCSGSSIQEENKTVFAVSAGTS